MRSTTWKTLNCQMFIFKTFTLIFLNISRSVFFLYWCNVCKVISHFFQTISYILQIALSFIQKIWSTNILRLHFFILCLRVSPLKLYIRIRHETIFNMTIQYYRWNCFQSLIYFIQTLCIVIIFIYFKFIGSCLDQRIFID